LIYVAWNFFIKKNHPKSILKNYDKLNIYRNGRHLSNWNFLKPSAEKTDFIIDCRSQSAYEEETLKGAYSFPFIKKAFGSDPDSQKKMYGPLNAILNLITQSKKTRVIVFDEGMGMFASRMLYFLRCAGIRESYMVSSKWPLDGTTEKGKHYTELEPAEKAVKAMPGIVDKAFMEKNLTRLQIFDSRTIDEYEGKLPRLTSPEQGTLCGRLPGAFLWDWQSFYDEDGIVISKEMFIKRLQSFPFMPERTTVLYDYNGARSCLCALMLKEVGYQDVNTYQGSWFEWRKSNLPKQAVSLYGGKAAPTAAPRVGGTDRK
jgi:thiosulfate/3-mercaptopyruvate sulfurtransferase